MWRRIFQRSLRVVEVTGPSNQKRIISQDEYIHEAVAENRLRAELGRLGTSNFGTDMNSVRHRTFRFIG
jgi:hypothetical protein